MESVTDLTSFESRGHLRDFDGEMTTNLLPDTPSDVREMIVATARNYIGTRFRHQGRVPGRGLDCVGVIVAVGRALGLVRYDVTAYPPLPPDAVTLAAHIGAAGFSEIPVSAVRPGDVYLMSFAAWPQHVALRTDRGILHAWLEARAVVEHSLDPSWRSRIVAAYRFPGVL